MKRKQFARRLLAVCLTPNDACARSNRKHAFHSGGRAVGRSGGRAVGRSGGRAVGRSGGRAVGRSGVALSEVHKANSEM